MKFTLIAISAAICLINVSQAVPVPYASDLVKRQEDLLGDVPVLGDVLDALDVDLLKKRQIGGDIGDDILGDLLDGIGLGLRKRDGLDLGDLLDLDDLLDGLLGDGLLDGLLGDGLLDLDDGLIGTILDLVQSLLGDDDEGLVGSILHLVEEILGGLGLDDLLGGLLGGSNYRDEVTKRSVLFSHHHGHSSTGKDTTKDDAKDSVNDATKDDKKDDKKEGSTGDNVADDASETTMDKRATVTKDTTKKLASQLHELYNHGQAAADTPKGKAKIAFVTNVTRLVAGALKNKGAH
ncbi:hypothetical protein BC940DRAFT_312624 [Gongronella butleri]|nr:hypothetical protein BC940DRAFT_312624 [Gongronella butleri]